MAVYNPAKGEAIRTGQYRRIHALRELSEARLIVYERATTGPKVQYVVRNRITNTARRLTFAEAAVYIVGFRHAYDTMLNQVRTLLPGVLATQAPNAEVLLDTMRRTLAQSCDAYVLLREQVQGAFNESLFKPDQGPQGNLAFHEVPPFTASHEDAFSVLTEIAVTVVEDFLTKGPVPADVFVQAVCDTMDRTVGAKIHQISAGFEPRVEEPLALVS